MTQQDKDLLLRDLCARLPYGVIIETTWKEKGIDECCDGTIGKLRGSQVEFFQEGEYSDIKPYLRPMSSITFEERSELRKYGALCISKEDTVEDVGVYGAIHGVPVLDYLNAHHFDFRGLIEKGLALEAPEGMYK